MNDALSRLSGLQRPRLLIRAARHGLVDYRRDRDLHRLIGGKDRPLSADASVHRLFCEEERLETFRCSGDAAYSLIRHVEVLIALMAETRLLRRDVPA